MASRFIRFPLPFSRHLAWLAFFFLLALIILGGTYSTTVYTTLKTQTKAETLAAHQAQAEVGALFISDYQHRLLEHLSNTASRIALLNLMVRGKSSHLKGELRGLAGRSDVEAVFVANASGDLVYRPPLPDRAEEFDPEPDLIKRVIQTRESLVSTLILGRRPGQNPTIMVAVPILDTDDQVLGMLGIRQKIAVWQSSFSRLATFPGRRFYLFDQVGNLVAGSPEPDEETKKLKDLTRRLITSDKAKGKVVSRLVQDPSARDHIFLSVALVPPMNWLFVIAHDYEAAMAPMQAMFDNILIFLLLLFGCLLLLAFLLFSRYRMQVQALERADGEARRLEAEVQARTADLRHSAERVRELSRQLIAAQEEERKKIALDLHDELGPLLGTLKMGLQALSQNPGQHDGRLTGELEHLIRMTQKIMDQVRGLGYTLRPAILDNFGLKAAIEDLCESVAEDNPVVITRRLDDVDGSRLSAEVQTTLFRFAQEGLTNAVRHSGNPRVEVELKNQGQKLTLSVRDFGRGFDVDRALAQALSEKRLGLIGMSERLDLIGGRLSIDSGKHGTLLTATINLEETDVH